MQFNSKAQHINSVYKYALPMERYREELTRIRNLLRGHPRGLTVTDIARRIGVNRNSVAKYLDVLITSGHVEKKAVGPAKVYFLSPRVPVSALLNLSSDYIIMLDEKRKIWHVNNSLLAFEGRSREEVLGRDLDEVPLMLLSDPELRARLSREAGEGEFSTEVDVKRGEDMHHFRATLVSTVFEDGSQGTTVILEDITEGKKHEERLRASEARYRAVVESQTEFVCRFLPDGTHVFVNEAYCNYFGKRRDEIEGHIFRPEIPEEDRPLLRRHFQDLTRDNPVGTIEHRIVMPDGAVRWQRWSDRAIFDEEARLTEYQSVGRDITARVQAEKALHESEEKFRGLAERSYDIIVLDDAEGTITYISPAIKQVLGYDPEEVIGRKFTELIPPRAQSLGIEAFERNRQGLPTQSAELEVLRKDGSIAVVESNAIPIMKDGRFTGIQVVCRDITARIRAEKALEESEEKFRSIAERAFDIILLIDEDGRITYASPAVRQSTGYDPEEVIGKPFLEFVRPVDLARATQSFERIRQGLPPHGLEIDVERKDGSLATLELRTTPITKEGRFTGAQLVCRDITARKASEEALRRSEEKIRSLFEASADGICLADEGGTIIEANRAVEEISGIPREEAIGRPIWEIAHRMLVPEYIPPNFLEMMRSDVQQLLGTGRSPDLLDIDEHPIQRPDGTRRTVQIRNFLIPQKTGYRMGSIIQDITRQKETRAALTEQVHLVRELLNRIPVPVFYKDAEGVYQGCNRAFEQLSGLSSDQIIGRKVSDLWPPGMSDRYGRIDSQILATGVPHQDEVEFQGEADGSRSLIFTRAPFYRANGSIQGIVGSMNEITHLRKAEQALKRSEEQFREMAETSPFPIAIIDEAGRYRYINRKFTEVFGYTLEDVPDGKRWFELAYPDPGERARVMDIWKTDLSSFGPGMVRPRRFRVRCRNGETREILFRPVTMRDGSQFVTYEDVTDRIHALESLTMSESRYRHLFNTMRCCFTLMEPVLDASGTPVDLSIIEANEALQRLTGRPREMLIGQHVKDLYPRTPGNFIETIASVALGGDPRKLTIYHPDLDMHLKIRAYSPVKGQVALIFRIDPKAANQRPTT